MARGLRLPLWREKGEKGESRERGERARASLSLARERGPRLSRGLKALALAKARAEALRLAKARAKALRLAKARAEAPWLWLWPARERSLWALAPALAVVRLPRRAPIFWPTVDLRNREAVAARAVCLYRKQT